MLNVSGIVLYAPSQTLHITPDLFLRKLYFIRHDSRHPGACSPSSRPPDEHGGGGGGSGGEPGRGRGRRGEPASQGEGRVSLLLRHPQRQH